jgi:hypothetical protein
MSHRLTVCKEASMPVRPAGATARPCEAGDVSQREKGVAWSPTSSPVYATFHRLCDLMGWDMGGSPIAGSQGPLPSAIA